MYFLRPHLQSCRLGGTRISCTQLLVLSHICLRTPPTWPGHSPHRLWCQIRCGDTAELSLRMVSCKSAISFPSVLMFFHGFFSLLAWHAYFCLISLNLALRLPFPGPSIQYKLFQRCIFSLVDACYYYLILNIEMSCFDTLCGAW